MELAIIGAGAASVCLLDALAQSPGPSGSITIYERSAELWRGRPYQRDVAAIKVNAPPEEMSVRFGDNAHFRRWLDEFGGNRGAHDEADPWCGTRYTSRSLYGDYLVHCAESAIYRLRSRGWRVDVVLATVTGAYRVRGRVQICADAGQSRVVDYAVLGVGGGRPHDAYGLNGSPGFVADPYPMTRSLSGIAEHDHVAVLGTGLTAVDTVMALVANGHRGAITMLSRSGTLPAVRQPHVPHELGYFTPEYMRELVRRRRRVSLADLIVRMRAELVAAGVDPSATFDEVRTHQTEDPIRRLRRHLGAVRSRDMGTRILQHAVPSSGQDVWQALREGDRRLVIDGYFRTIMSLCCPMPPASAETLLRLVDSGQLNVRGGARTVERDGEGGFRHFADRDGAADIVINAVNSPADGIAEDTGPLVDALVAGGLAEPDPYGGLAIDRETSRCVVNSEPQNQLFALGDITFGSLFFTFGIPVLVDRSVDIVAAIRAGEGAPSGGADLDSMPSSTMCLQETG